MLPNMCVACWEREETGERRSRKEREMERRRHGREAEVTSAGRGVICLSHSWTSHLTGEMAEEPLL